MTAQTIQSTDKLLATTPVKESEGTKAASRLLYIDNIRTFLISSASADTTAPPSPKVPRFLEGKKLIRGTDYEAGFESGEQGTRLVLWLHFQSDKETAFTIKAKS